MIEITQPPPPSHIQLRDEDDPDFRPARERVYSSRRSIFSFARRPQERQPHRRPISLEEDHLQLNTQQELGTDSPILVEKPELLEEDAHDEYRWAIVYENQRGLMFFSMAYYSSVSLLPRDPPPFSMPSNASDAQPDFTLSDYPLPDSRWRWVSRHWMVDMRSNSGDVQHDGFEYNWLFRRHKWHARPGKFGNGTWVRRRRWLRLMVKPREEAIPVQLAKQVRHFPSSSDNQSNHRGSIASVVQAAAPPGSSSWQDPFSIDPRDVWQGNILEDGARCLSLLQYFERDGKKLELWQWWLGLRRQPRVHERFTSDMTSSVRAISLDGPGNDILLDHIAAFLRTQCHRILRLYVYPESRAEFFILLRDTGLLSRLNFEYELRWIVQELGFWSYRKVLGLLDVNSTNS